jgi:dUTP pyrophosphatase
MIGLMQIKVRKLYPDAMLPSFAHPGDAGMDLYTRETITIKAGEIAKIPTGLSMEFSDEYVVLFWDKSGLSSNHFLKVMGGVMDSGYRGEYIVSLINLGKEDYILEKGHKVAQMLVQKIYQPKIKEVDLLNKTSRGLGRHGSTGK